MLRVSKQFAGQPQALSHISLSIHWGEFVSIEGPAGAGKSTLLRLMGLLEKPSQGQMAVDGVDVSTLSEERAFARRRRLLHIQPSDGFFPKLNLKDNLSLALEVANTKPGPGQCMEALAAVHLEGLWRQKPRQLRPSQRLRLVLARALIRQPRMLLVDGCMDALEEADFPLWRSLLRQCQERGATVVVAGRQGLPGIRRRLRLEGGMLRSTEVGAHV